jgi:hypothetical protein
MLKSRAGGQPASVIGRFVPFAKSGYLPLQTQEIFLNKP